ncbi:hypothetical protein [Streptomyces varsoviensis]|uniref:Alanine-rich protein n=1 Tax=Streptomyces varsoviensis TaxID=67373 RepID=A0ABR5J8D4_9ACTN|nr:hypothetical protein [Streptomyces varsoviensis]KOG89619.1 alanine-rich protein [Streptomyces varsoviensis]
MIASAFLYPWDIVGDPDAARRVAELGVQRVTLASAYHSTRALTPRHPARRIVTARHAAVLYPPDADRWRGRELRPYEQSWVAGADPFGEAASALADAGLDVHTWVVLAHNSRLGDEHPHTSVRNAYGDRYPWAPCIARPDVRTYLVDLAAEAATRPGATGTDLESCGWYGLAHLHAHDKTGGVELDGAGQYLMSLCFCDACAAGYAEHSVDAEELRATVVRALRPYWSGGGATTGTPGRGAGRAGEWAAVRGLLGPDLAEAVRAWRESAATALQRACVAAVRAAAGADRPGFRVMLHADPASHRCGANAGVVPADVLGHADGVVLPCTGPDAAREEILRPFTGPGATDRPDRPDRTLAANLTVVSGMGGSPATLAADAAHAAALGAHELRLYHAGLASDADLAAVRTALARLG